MNGPIVLSCRVWARPGCRDGLRDYEDRVLALLTEHDGRLLVRTYGHGAGPDEGHLIRFASETAKQGWLDDPRRTALQALREDVLESCEVHPVELVPPETVPAPPAGTDRLSERDARVIAGVEKLRFFPLEVVSGYGAVLYDPEGRSMLDFSASWTASGLGHGDAGVRAAVDWALREPPGASLLSAVSPEPVALAEELIAMIPIRSEDARVYLGHAGTDANDVAVRACRHATGRPRMLAFRHGYHGGLGTAQAVSGVHVEAGVPADPHTVFLPYPDPLRPDASGAASRADLVEHVLGLVDAELAGGDVAGVIVEPIQSDGGLVVPPPGFLPGLREACDRHGTLLVLDEVKVGMGRTGRLLAHQHEGITADLVSLGKALGGGLPLSALVGPASALVEPTATALLTTVGNPACCAAARTVLARLRESTLVADAAARGCQLVTGLQGYAASARPGARHVGEVRGRGLCVGVELVDSPQTLVPADRLTAKVAYRAWQLGLVCYPVRGNVLELTPPLVVTAEQIAAGATLLGRAIDDVVSGLVPDETVAAFSGWA